MPKEAFDQFVQSLIDYKTYKTYNAVIIIRDYNAVWLLTL